jgi:hypothetical protein
MLRILHPSQTYREIGAGDPMNLLGVMPAKEGKKK